MFPKLITISIPDFLQGFLPAHISLYSFGVLVVLGIVAGLLVTVFKAKKLGMSMDKVMNLYMWLIFASVLGSKFFFYLEDFETYLHEPKLIFQQANGGGVFYGALIFAVIATIWWLRREKIPFKPVLDIAAFAVPVVHIFGRLGCFLAGCCYGKVCTSSLGITFTNPESLALPLNVPLYPTQLFDLGLNLAILLIVFLLEKRQKFQGQLFLVYLIIYAVGRSIIEMYRGDEARGFLFGGSVSHSQFIAILVLIGCIVFWKRWRKQPLNALK